MKKGNKIIQKLVFYGFLIASCLVILASLAFVSKGWTVLYASKKDTSASMFMEIKRAVLLAKADGHTFEGLARGCYSYVFSDEETARAFYSDVWFGIQKINNLLFALGVGSLVCLACCGIAGSFSRKKFYVSNLISGIVTGIYGIVMSIIILLKTGTVKSDFNSLQPDFQLYLDACQKAEKTPVANTINDSNFSISMITSILFIVICLGFISYNTYRFIRSKKQIIKSVSMEAISNEE